MKAKLRVILVLSSIVFTACGIGGPEQSAFRAVNRGEKLGCGDTPLCLQTYEDFEVRGRVLGFEIIDKKGFNFGFNLLNQFFEALGFSISAEKGQMVFAVDLSEILSRQQSTITELGKGESQKREFHFQLDVVKLKADINYFWQTPLSTLAERTIVDSMAHLNTSLSERKIKWSTKAVYSEGDSIVVPIGALSNVAIGDSFEIFNVEHLWSGSPCESRHLLEKLTTDSPIVEAVAVQVESHSTLLQIYRRNEMTPIQTGARVFLRSRMNASSRPLLRSAQLIDIESVPLTLADGSHFDVTPYVSDIFKTVAPRQGINLIYSGAPK